MSNLASLFQNEEFYTLALTHKSWVNEHPGKRTSNERLEFLGDAVLEFVVSKEIYSRFPDKEEGYLTALRANLVNTISLPSVAKKFELGENLFFSKGEEETGGRKNPSLLANTFEAFVGSLFLDVKLSKVEVFIGEHLLTSIDENIKEPLKDPKSLFQEYVQAQGYSAPRYEVIAEKGPDHNKVFTLQVLVNGSAWGVGEGRNKCEAAQEAARQALKQIEKKNGK